MESIFESGELSIKKEWEKIANNEFANLTLHTLTQFGAISCDFITVFVPAFMTLVDILSTVTAHTWMSWNTSTAARTLKGFRGEL